MKQLLCILAITLSLSAVAQGNGNAKGKYKDKKNKTVVVNNTDNNYSNKGSAKNQPKKVQAALLRDYPAARNITWDKYKGDYTATFNNGPWRSTAVYHANGDRRDTRTVLRRDQLPGTIWDIIFKRDNVVPVEYIQIERPSTLEKIFRVVSSVNNTTYYYDKDGNKITYDY
jgi:hypothetical protein